ncbi:hypothetical protein LguiA_017887 [Lonicera macranthoides]
MAISAPTTAATTCILRRDFHHSSPPTNSSRNYISFAATKPPRPRRFRIRNSSGDVSAETATTETDTETEKESESPVEVQKGLVNGLNVERVLRGIPITDIDHYGRLGIPRGCPYDEVTVAYKKKVEQLMNEQQGEGEEENEELSKKLELLKESHSILTTVEDRRLYDWSLARNGNPDIYVWPFEVDITQTQSPETPPPAEPEDEEPTKLLGYFMLAWLVLGFTLSIVLNR